MTQGHKRILGFFVTFLLVVSGIISIPTFQANAAEGVDLTAELTGTTNGIAGGDYTYELKFRNVGTEDTQNATFKFTMPAGSEYTSAECRTEGGAVCADQFVLPEGKIGADNPVTGTISNFPNGGVVIVTVQGKFPVESSASVTLEIATADGVLDSDLNSNKVNQQARLDVSTGVEIKKEQDSEVSQASTSRSYTVTYINNGPLDLPNLKVHDLFKLTNYEQFPGASLKWNVQCDRQASGESDCPEWADGSEQNMKFTDGYGIELFDAEVHLKAKHQVVFRVTVDLLASCVIGGENALISNKASQNGAVGFTVNGGEPVIVHGHIEGYKPCPEARLEISKTQDKETVRLGEARTYKVVYENTSNVDIKGMRVRELYESPEASSASFNPKGFNLINGYLEWNVTCDPNETTAGVCPEWANGTPKRRYEFRWTDLFSDDGSFESDGSTDRRLDLPAGAKVTFTIPVTTFGKCRIKPDFNVKNTAKRFESAGLKLTGGLDASIEGRVIDVPGCEPAELIVEKTQTKDTYVYGEPIDYTITYTNNGPASINKILVRDDLRLNNTKGIVFGSSSFEYWCDSDASTMECPFAKHKKELGAEFLQDAYANTFQEYVNIPAGKKLVIKAKFIFNGSCTPDSDTLVVRNKATYSSGDVQYIGRSNGASAGGDDGSTVEAKLLCNDVTTNTIVSKGKFDPKEPMNISVIIGNSVGVAEEFPVKITLPGKGHFEIAPETVPACSYRDTRTGTETECDNKWDWDEKTHSFNTTVKRLPAGMELLVTISGKAGIVNIVGGESNKISTFAQSLGDVKPGADEQNRSDNTYVIQNTQVNATVKHVLTTPSNGGAPIDLHFEGTLKCAASGDIDFPIIIKKGATSAEFSPNMPGVWKYDDCEITVSRPTESLPDGYVWVTAAEPITAYAANYIEDRTFNYSWEIEKKPVPGEIKVNTWTDPLSDGEGLKTSLSQPVNDVEVTLVKVASDGSETSVATAKTVNGTHVFTKLADGKYYVRFDSAPVGYEPTKPSANSDPTAADNDSDSRDGRSGLVNITEGKTVVIDTGFKQVASVPQIPPTQPVPPVPPTVVVPPVEVPPVPPTVVVPPVEVPLIPITAEEPKNPPVPAKPKLANTGISSWGLPASMTLLIIGMSLLVARRKFIN